jgi:hypothetical protein
MPASARRHSRRGKALRCGPAGPKVAPPTSSGRCCAVCAHRAGLPGTPGQRVILRQQIQPHVRRGPRVIERHDVIGVGIPRSPGQLLSASRIFIISAPAKAACIVEEDVDSELLIDDLVDCLRDLIWVRHVNHCRVHVFSGRQDSCPRPCAGFRETFGDRPPNALGPAGHNRCFPGQIIRGSHGSLLNYFGTLSSIRLGGIGCTPFEGGVQLDP